MKPWQKVIQVQTGEHPPMIYIHRKEDGAVIGQIEQINGIRMFSRYTAPVFFGSDELLAVGQLLEELNEQDKARQRAKMDVSSTEGAQADNCS